MKNELSNEERLEAVKDKLRQMGIMLDGRVIEFGRRRIVGPDGRNRFMEYVHVEKGDGTQGPIFPLESLGL